MIHQKGVDGEVPAIFFQLPKAKERSSWVFEALLGLSQVDGMLFDEQSNHE